MRTVLVDELELLADLGARKASELGEFVRIAGDEKRGVARFQAERRGGSPRCARAPMLFASGPRPPAPVALGSAASVRLVLRAIEEQDIAKPGLTLALRPCVHPIGESPLPSAGRGNRPDFVFRRFRADGRTLLKPEPRKCSETFCMTSGLRRSGLSDPYLRIASE